jgi:DNA-binding winged helix-turn-helix (wHTH) protein
VHVSNLRKKLAAAGAPAVIATVRGVGYRLAPDLLAGGEPAGRPDADGTRR